MLFMGELRIMRGEVETKLAEIAEQHAASWQTIVARPYGVTNGESAVSHVMPAFSISVTELAAAMVEMALHGSDKTFVESAELRKVGKAALQAHK